MARKSFQAANIELRHKTYYAVLYVPEDARHIIGKTKFTRSTRTGDRFLAEKRAAAFVLAWKAEIERARCQTGDELIEEARDLHAHLQRKDLIPGTVEEIIEDRIHEISNNKSKRVAEYFEDIATGNYSPLEPLIAEWEAHEIARGLKQKTINQMVADVNECIPLFPTTKQINQKTIDLMVDALNESGTTPSSINRHFGSLRSFYTYLQDIGTASKTESNPFITPEKYKPTKKVNSKSLNKRKPYLPFTADEVVQLIEQAERNQDKQLVFLIKVGAYTGARIEEICSIKCEDVNIIEGYISITGSKTEAGIRKIPIHSKLKNLLQTLVNDSTDGYIFSDQNPSKYNERSNALGKRFGRMKTKLKFNSRYVFHSLRKTLTTALENALVPENVTADIVGHEKPRMTYGVYSGGTSVSVMQEAIEKVHYPF